MDNYQIADALSLLGKLTDIHGENGFKAKSYGAAAFAIEKLPYQLSDTAPEKIPLIPSIGSSNGQKIIELLQTGKLEALEQIIAVTPPGVIEMLHIKGIGPKKIHSIWKEMEIETIGELLYACKENRLKLYKGFGEKTQQQVIDAILFYQSNTGNFLFAQVEKITEPVLELLRHVLPDVRIELTGQMKRQLEIIDKLEFLITADTTTIESGIRSCEGFSITQRNDNEIHCDTPAGIKMILHATTEANRSLDAVKTTSSVAFWKELSATANNYPDEKAVFSSAQLPYFPPFLRENPDLINRFRNQSLPDIIGLSDIRGIIHSHSNWSDGSNTLEEMARGCIDRGLEYLVVSDHSQSAFYAQGLSPERIFSQQEAISKLNTKLHPFRIFKSIEADILNDGRLDYEDSVLASFDLVIASVHSNLKMNEEKAMNRLIKAIENPYTTILGHMTGRLLLSRPGYPVDHKKIIDACAANKVAIEINSHPSRLDIDWRHIDYALEKNVMLSINPDAHSIEGLDDVRYGILVAQKAMLPKTSNLSSMSLTEFEKYLSQKK